ncbi:MAG: PIN domain-containing protein [Terriglobales bacterium]
MRLIVADTNFLVSAAIHPGGAPAVIVSEWILRGLVQTVVCPAVAAEYGTVFRRPRFRRYGFPPPWLEFLVRESLHLPDPPPWPQPGPDASDTVFLALAALSGARLITGNLRHFPSRIRSGVAVLDPAAYLRSLQATG